MTISKGWRKSALFDIMKGYRKADNGKAENQSRQSNRYVGRNTQ